MRRDCARFDTFGFRSKAPLDSDPTFLVRRFTPTLVARSGTLGPRVLRPMEMTAQEIYSLMAAQEIYFAFESSTFRSPSAPWVRGACCGILLAAAVDLIVRFRAMAPARPGVDERSDFVPWTRTVLDSVRLGAFQGGAMIPGPARCLRCG